MRKRDIIVLAAILYIGKAVLDTIGDAIGIMCKGICKELIKKAENGDNNAEQYCNIMGLKYKRNTTAKRQIGFRA